MKKILAFDLGIKTIGVAYSDELLMFAHPLKTFYTTEKKWHETILEIFNSIDINNFFKIIIGKPKTLKNNDSDSTKRVYRFQSLLENILIEKNLSKYINVILWDERLTTKIAHNILNFSNRNNKTKKKVIDTVAATVILENYLQNLKHNK